MFSLRASDLVYEDDAVGIDQAIASCVCLCPPGSTAGNVPENETIIGKQGGAGQGKVSLEHCGHNRMFSLLLAAAEAYEVRAVVDTREGPGLHRARGRESASARLSWRWREILRLACSAKQEQPFIRQGAGLVKEHENLPPPFSC